MHVCRGIFHHEKRLLCSVDLYWKTSGKHCRKRQLHSLMTYTHIGVNNTFLNVFLKCLGKIIGIGMNLLNCTAIRDKHLAQVYETYT